MSNVQTLFLFTGGQAAPLQQKITTNAATLINGADGSTGQINIAEFYLIENAGSTPNLTVEITNGTDTYYLPDTSKVVWNARAVTARQAVEFSSRIIPHEFKLKVTSSDAAGKFDFIGTKVGKAR